MGRAELGVLGGKHVDARKSKQNYMAKFKNKNKLKSARTLISTRNLHT